MDVRLAYGETGLHIDVDPAVTTVVEPVHHEAAADQPGVLTRALRFPVAGPLRERVARGQTVAISACDGTRPQPRQLMIPAVLAELDGIVRLEDVVILVATGTHRGNSDGELRRMFGDAVVDSVAPWCAPPVVPGRRSPPRPPPPWRRWAPATSPSAR
ncbi:protein of unknown function [Streptomyces sp. DvalAA-14]|uniref:lactate racemase domain-containing protein n=1 Tax=unclassified Streptomyces TaxID=2593676 RepID=UPI00081B120D|nr:MULTISPECIES: lactate racemase domain-containing protein [unclassified Streptomyces]SCD67443.1 protein of unknown function [Streptomyces sp. DvalAA-14]